MWELYRITSLKAADEEGHVEGLTITEFTGRALHSFTLWLNLNSFRPHTWVALGHMGIWGTNTAQVELKWPRV